MDVDARFPVQEEGTFIDRSKHVVHKQCLEQEDVEDVEVKVSPPSEVKTAFLDSQVDLGVKKRRKRRKRRKKRQKKAVQTLSTFTKGEYKGYFWKSTVIFCAILVTGTAAFSIQNPYMGEVPEIPNHRAASKVIQPSVKEGPKIQAHRSEYPKYESVSADMCAATYAVRDPPIRLMKETQIENLNTSVRCPCTEEHFGIKTCFHNDSSIMVVFKIGQAKSLFIEHDTGMEQKDQTIAVDMNNKACYLSMEDQTSKPEESENDEAKKERTASVKDRSQSQGQNDGSSLTDAGVPRCVGGIGALFLIITLAGALFYVAKNSRDREQQFTRLLGQRVP